jgi:hypothetical protein
LAKFRRSWPAANPCTDNRSNKNCVSNIHNLRPLALDLDLSLHIGHSFDLGLRPQHRNLCGLCAHTSPCIEDAQAFNLVDDQPAQSLKRVAPNTHSQPTSLFASQLVMHLGRIPGGTSTEHHDSHQRCFADPRATTRYRAYLQHNQGRKDAFFMCQIA